MLLSMFYPNPKKTHDLLAAVLSAMPPGGQLEKCNFSKMQLLAVFKQYLQKFKSAADMMNTVPNSPLFFSFYILHFLFSIILTLIFIYKTNTSTQYFT